jgi:tRNA A-37 threonylcarbamoyl transferase component Bud32
LTDRSTSSPYIPGNEILLKTSDGGTEIKAVNLKTFPTTLSCCMVLRFVEPAIFNNTSECVLKLYDRRFSNQLREDFEASPWTPELEKEYQSFVECGDAEEFFSYWDAEKERDIYWSANYVSSLSRWSAAKREAYLQWDTTDAYETEKKAYEQMADLEGEDVPKIFGEVVLSQPTAFQGQEQNDTAKTDKYEVEGDQEDSTSTTLSEVDTNPHLVKIPGILMQHINGFILTDLHEHLPKDCWQSIVDTAIEKLARIHESGTLNRDVNTRSFMVDPLTRKVMMIDFGMKTFREDAEDDIEWERLYAHSDAEEAIGLLMRAFLKERGGGSIIYKPSEIYWRLQYRYRGMEGEREGGTEEEEEYVKENKDFVFE